MAPTTAGGHNSYWFTLERSIVDWPRPSRAGDTSQITISADTQEIEAAAFNFVAWTDVPGRVKDSAPNDGVSHYSLEANGPGIDSVDVKTSPSSGPRAGKQFVIVPTGLRLEPDGSTTQTPVLPESYACAAKLGTRALVGRGIGRCTFALPKKNSRGKRLEVMLTVDYEGSTKTVPFLFRVR
jgi:hypothetical protein